MNRFKFFQREVTIEIVHEFLKKEGVNVNFKLMLSVKPFMEFYIDCPVGFAETDNLNNIDECVNIIRDMNQHLNLKSTIRQEKRRFLEGRNAGGYGRHIGRLAYLLTNK